MYFELSKEQNAIKQAAKEFAKKEFPEVCKECDREEIYPWKIWEKACEFDFIGTFIQEDYGGAGLGYFENCLITEEFWKVDPGCGCILLSAFGSQIIQKFGTESQKKKYLPLLPTGKAILATAITEPDAGSDIFNMQTTAEKNGNEYIINGSKTFITNGTLANYVLVYCVTDSEAPRNNKYSVLIVDTTSPGFESQKIKGKLGIRASDTAELSFKNVRVPEENLLGGTEGQGFAQIMQLFNICRVEAASQGVGVAQGSLDLAVAHVRQRKVFGKPIGTFQATKFKLAEIATKVEAARMLTYQAGWLIDQGKTDPKLIAMAKYYSGEVGVRAADEALQLHGGYGYIGDYDIERFYRDAKIVEIYEATKEIEKNTIGNILIGKL